MSPDAVEIKYRKFTVADYYKMAEIGILHEDDRVELIEGDIAAMEPMSGRHAACTDVLNYILVPRSNDAVQVRSRAPVRLSPLCEPHPDAMLIHRRRRRTEHPGPADVLLLIEVAD